MECELSYYFEVLETIENPELVMRGMKLPGAPPRRDLRSAPTSSRVSRRNYAEVRQAIHPCRERRQNI